MPQPQPIPYHHHNQYDSTTTTSTITISTKNSLKYKNHTTNRIAIIMTDVTTTTIPQHPHYTPTIPQSPAPLAHHHYPTTHSPPQYPPGEGGIEVASRKSLNGNQGNTAQPLCMDVLVKNVILQWGDFFQDNTLLV